MEAILFLALPTWLDERLRERAESEATNRQGQLGRC